ncbi:MAG TPA: AAA family ATPase [Pyrinomonadaceae bacterium]|jgi:hypothetical protein|nr:AAA family ATPase [Pyrinomonadaceae bacterium]
MKNKKNETPDWKVLHKKFKAYTTGHPRLLEVSAEVKRAIKRRDEGIVMVTGPTRAGKTTLLMGVINSILLENLPEMEKDPGFLPAAWMEAYAYKRGYKWRDHWYGCLEALNEPLIKYKSAGYNILSDRNASHAPTNHRYEKEDILRRSFENTTDRKRTSVFGVDEAQSIVVGSSRDNHRANVEVIKSVAQNSGALHILCGNYDVLELFNLSGQIGARTGRPIHFSRYRTDCEKDLVWFAAVVADFTSKMPVPEPPNFEKILEYLIDRSLGLVGLLKIWFSDALGDALEDGRPTVMPDDLEKHEPPEEVLDRISKEIILGERRLEQNGSKFALIKARMYAGTKFDEEEWKKKQSSISKDASGSGAEAETPAATPEGSGELGDAVPAKNRASKRPRRNSRPFERAPVRDKVGHGRKKKVA